MRLTVFSLLLLMVMACEDTESESAGGFPSLPDTSSDATGGPDAAPDATPGGPDATGDSSEPLDAPEQDQMTCEGASEAFIEGLGAKSGSYTGCTKDADCELIVPTLDCKTQKTTIEECPLAVSDVLAYAEALVDVTGALCPEVPEACVATPGCPEMEAVCSGGACTAVLVDP
jgi:hypothetical protein